MLPIVKFALNNAVHSPIGYTTVYVNGLTHPRVLLTLLLGGLGINGGGMADRLDEISTANV